MVILEKLQGLGRRALTSTRRQWKLSAFDTALACLTTMVGVTVLVGAGFLATPEQWFYDIRTRFCSVGRPAPTTQLVHLDMDDASVQDDELGRWPWPRADQAELLSELAEAHPKAVALDVIYDAPERDEIREDPPGTFARVDHDAALEAALAKLGCAIVASGHSEAGGAVQHGPAYEQLATLLRSNLRLGVDEAVAALGRLTPAAQEAAEADFYLAREEAIAREVDRVMGDRSMTDMDVSLAITGEPPSEFNSLGRLVTRATERWRADRAILRSRFAASRDVALRSLDDRAPEELPLRRFSDAAADTAFFTYVKTGDGSIRNIPLAFNLRGKIGVSLGLALAARALDVPISKLELLEDRLIIPAPRGAITVPLRTVKYDSLARPIGGVLDLPWFGKRGTNGWQEMYGPGQTISLVKVWRVVQSGRRLESDNAQLKDACLGLLQAFGENDRVEALGKRTFKPRDVDAWVPEALKVLTEFGPQIAAARLRPHGDPGPRPLTAGPALDQWLRQSTDRDICAGADAIPILAEDLPKLGSQLTAGRRELRTIFEGKAVMMGWTATGLTDFVTTPLHPAAPGVRVHGVVFNAIMTGNFLRFAPAWLNLLLTGVLGALMTGAVVRHSPLFSAGAAMAFAGAYTGINIYAFGPHSFVLALAGPLTSVAATWSVGSIVRYRLEKAARDAVIKRFSTYVDPQLVNYVLANPDQARLDGAKRRMTVVFTDLAGFTTLSEKLGERTVGLLNDYFNVMFPVIRKHSGHLNKLLGDGMMFFYNGLEPNDRHASDAFDTVLELQIEVTKFNASLVAKGLPTVKMRCGITTGDMIAGDAGGETYSDYTVLGDIVNLASRLEGANKKSGTLIICNAEARAAAGNAFVTRPIGVIQVVGKTEGIEAYEVVCRRDAATADQLAMAQRTEEMVAAYRRADLCECERLAALVRPAEFAELYLHLCKDLQTSGIPDGFNGTIVLDSK